MTDLIQFYRDKIQKFQDLRQRCERPDRIDFIIFSYREELKKQGDKIGTTEQRIL